MRIESQREEFQRALSVAGYGLPKGRNPIPVLDQVLIREGTDGLQLVATDLDVSVQVDCGARVTDSSPVLLDGKQLQAIVKNVKESEVIIEANGSGNAKVNGTGMAMGFKPETDYPLVPEASWKDSTSFDGPAFQKGLKAVAFAITKELSRYSLNAALFESVNHDTSYFCATDGYRLVIHETDGTGGYLKPKMLISKRAADVLLKLKNPKHIEVASKGQFTYFRATSNAWPETVTIASRTVEGQFPNWRQIVDPVKQSFPYSVAHADLLSALEQSLPVAKLLEYGKSASPVITLELSTAHCLTVSAKSDKGEFAVSLPLSGNIPPAAIKAGFNPKYLIEFLKTCPAQYVGLSLTDAGSAMVLQSLNDDDSRTLYALMPCKL